jgi:hypothetical protein
MSNSNLLQDLRRADATGGGPLWGVVSSATTGRKVEQPRTVPQTMPVRLGHSPQATPAVAIAARHDVGPALDKVWASCGSALRHGLLQTAFLSRLTRASVVEISQTHSLADFLERLADEGILVRRDIATPAVLRYETQFRAHLQALARTTLEPGLLADLLWRVTALMERELETLQPTRMAAPRIRIHALGGFHILRDGAPLPRHRKAPGKPLTLVKALVALGPNGVPSHTLADLLWPDAEGDSADARLTTTLHRARALLGVHDAVLKDNGELSLNRSLVACDVFDFHHLVQRLETQHGGTAAMRTQLLEAYPAPLLPACTGEAWLQPCRERLAAKFAGAIARLGRRLDAEGNRDEAQALYLEALAREPMAACLRRFL